MTAKNYSKITELIIFLIDPVHLDLFNIGLNSFMTEDSIDPVHLDLFNIGLNSFMTEDSII